MNSLRQLLQGHKLKMAITGSAGLGVAQESGIDFVQEVFATAGAVKRNQPNTDVQPLLNQGADKENIAASIFQAVVDQTIAGLAQGRRIAGNVLFLGGPLSFMKGLQQRFIETLKLKENEAHFPELAPYYVAYGAALYSESIHSYYTYDELEQLLQSVSDRPSQFAGLAPLFADQPSYEAFKQRHRASSVPRMDIEQYTGPAYLGMDAGSTTTNMVLIDPNYRLLYSDYRNNMGHPVEAVRDQLTEL